MNPLLKEMRDIIKENEKLKQTNALLKQQAYSVKEIDDMKAYIAKLEAQVGEAHEITAPIPVVEVPKKKCLRDIIQPLIIKRGYTCKYNKVPGTLYGEIYKMMQVDWSAVCAAYAMAHNGACTYRYIVIEADPALISEFERVVNILLAE